MRRIPGDKSRLASAMFRWVCRAEISPGMWLLAAGDPFDRLTVQGSDSLKFKSISPTSNMANGQSLVRVASAPIQRPHPDRAPQLRPTAPIASLAS